MLIIEQKRREKKVTQSDLAKALGVTQGAVSQWEKGVTEPGISFLIKMSAFFECTVDELLQKGDPEDGKSRIS